MKYIKLFESFENKISDVKDILLDIKDMGYTIDYKLIRSGDLVLYKFTIENKDDVDIDTDDDSVYAFVLPQIFAKPLSFDENILETIDRVKRYGGGDIDVRVFGQFGKPNKNKHIVYTEDWLSLDYIIKLLSNNPTNLCGIWNKIQISFTL